MINATETGDGVQSGMTLQEEETNAERICTTHLSNPAGTSPKQGARTILDDIGRDYGGILPFGVVSANFYG
jgi:hypothetical protein